MTKESVLRIVGRSLPAAIVGIGTVLPVARGRPGDPFVREIVWSSSTNYPLLGHILAGVPDANGDGYSDIAIGSPYNFGAAGSVRLYSGLTRSVLFEWSGSLNPCALCFGEKYGAALATLDWNQDGHSDLAIGAPAHQPAVPTWNPVTGRVEVRSGLDGTALGSMFPPPNTAAILGADLDAPGDLNGDGWPELLVSAPGQQIPLGANTGGFYAVSAPSFGSLYYYPGWQGGQLFGGGWVASGGGVRGAGDIDADGVPDFFVGSPTTDVVVQNEGLVRAYSGATGMEIGSWYGGNGIDSRGTLVGELGDVTGDGKAELAFSERLVNPSNGNTIGLVARVLDTVTGSFVHSFGPFGPLDTATIWTVNGLPDVDEDGFPELVYAVDYPSSPGFLRIVSGATGATIFQLDEPPSIFTAYGRNATAVPDINADGLVDFVMSGGLDVAGIEGVEVWVGRNLDTTLPAPTLGGAVTYSLRAPALSGRVFQIVLSTSATAGFELGPFRVFLDPDALFILSFGCFLNGTLDATGRATYAIPIPNDPTLSGATIHASGAIFDPAGPLGIRTILTRATFVIP